MICETETYQSIMVDSEEVYAFCGSVDSKEIVVYFAPSMNSASDELIPSERLIRTDGWMQNREGIWVRIQGTVRNIRNQKFLFVSEILDLRSL